MRLTTPSSLALVAACAVALGACGGNSTSSTSTNTSRPAGPGGAFALSASTRSCLKKQGVNLPARRGQGQRPPGGTRPPGGGNAGPPRSGGRPPNGAQGRRRSGSRFKKLRQALQKCGVNLPRGGPGGPPQGAPGSS